MRVSCTLSPATLLVITWLQSPRIAARIPQRSDQAYCLRRPRWSTPLRQVCFVCLCDHAGSFARRHRFDSFTGSNSSVHQRNYRSPDHRLFKATGVRSFAQEIAAWDQTAAVHPFAVGPSSWRATAAYWEYAHATSPLYSSESGARRVGEPARRLLLVEHQVLDEKHSGKWTAVNGYCAD